MLRVKPPGLALTGIIPSDFREFFKLSFITIVVDVFIFLFLLFFTLFILF